MKTVLSLSVVWLVLVAGTQQASAQYPGHGRHGTRHHGYGQSNYGHHYDYHYGPPPTPSPPPIVLNYGAAPQPYLPTAGQYGGGQYGGGMGYGQVAIPGTTTNYSNNYYVQPTHEHHPWHPGHYLLGHH
jgi:hypothetical protein